MTCESCGAQVTPHARFCRVCGAPVAAARDLGEATDPRITEPTPTETFTLKSGAPLPGLPPTMPGPLSPERRRRSGGLQPVTVVLIVVVVVLLAAVAALAAGVFSGGESEPDASQAGPPPERATSPRESSESTDTRPALRSLASELASILDVSAQGRAEIRRLVTDVCSLSAAETSAGIDSVIENRERVIDELDGLVGTVSGQGDRLVTLLRDAIQVSLDSNYEYRAWFDTVGETGCPGGNAPTSDPAFQQADALSGQATAAKQAFVAAYNPVASSFGLREWTDGDF